MNNNPIGCDALDFGIIWPNQFFGFPSEPILVQAVYVAKMLDPLQPPDR